MSLFWIPRVLMFVVALALVVGCNSGGLPNNGAPRVLEVLPNGNAGTVGARTTFTAKVEGQVTDWQWDFGALGTSAGLDQASPTVEIGMIGEFPCSVVACKGDDCSDPFPFTARAYAPLTGSSYILNEGHFIRQFSLALLPDNSVGIGWLDGQTLQFVRSMGTLPDGPEDWVIQTVDSSPTAYGPRLFVRDGVPALMTSVGIYVPDNPEVPEHGSWTLHPGFVPDGRAADSYQGRLLTGNHLALTPFPEQPTDWLPLRPFPNDQPTPLFEVVDGALVAVHGTNQGSIPMGWAITTASIPSASTDWTVGYLPEWGLPLGIIGCNEQLVVAFNQRYDGSDNRFWIAQAEWENNALLGDWRLGRVEQDGASAMPDLACAGGHISLSGIRQTFFNRPSYTAIASIAKSPTSMELEGWKLFTARGGVPLPQPIYETSTDLLDLSGNGSPKVLFAVNFRNDGFNEPGLELMLIR